MSVRRDGEAVPALVKLLDNEDISNAQLCRYVKGPDFPTAGIVYGKDSLRTAYATGKGGAWKGRVQAKETP